MLMRAVSSVALVIFITVGSIQAEQSSRDPASAAPTIEWRPNQNMKIPGTNYEIIFDLVEKRPGENVPSQALMNAIKRWISINFDLRATYPNPDIQLVSPEKIIVLRYKGLLSDKPRDIVIADQKVSSVPLEDMVAANDRQDALAVYDDEMKTIYLPTKWTGSTPAQLSILVHEMVHHLQGMVKTEYECPQAREQLAYAAQEMWLGLFSRSLQSEFEIDPLALVVSTRCIY
jgi:hypothetical protein